MWKKSDLQYSYFWSTLDYNFKSTINLDFKSILYSYFKSTLYHYILTFKKFTLYHYILTFKFALDLGFGHVSVSKFDDDFPSKPFQMCSCSGEGIKKAALMITKNDSTLFGPI